MPAARISWLASKTVVSIAGALLSFHRETRAREGAGSRQRHARVRNVHVRRSHRTRGPRVSGQVFLVFKTTK